MKNLQMLFYGIATISQIATSFSANFTIVPSSQIVAEEELAIFRCQHPQAFDVLWLINGSTIQFYPGDAIAEIITSVRPPLHILYINAHRGFNESLVRCRAVFMDGRLPQLSPSVELLVQDSLGAVSNLFTNVWKDIIYINWKAPFTLNLTNIEPDITYCVQIFNNSDDHQIVHACNVTDTEFLYPLQQNISSCCHLLDENCNITVVIVPVNGAGNGLTAQAHTPSAANVTITHIDVHAIDSGRMEVTFNIQPAGSACDCSLLLWKINAVNTMYGFNESNGLRCEYSIISLEFSTDMLSFNTHYEGNISVSSNNFNINISTHDLQNITLINDRLLTATFINNSRAKGAFVFLIRDQLAGNTPTVAELQSAFSFIIPNPLDATTSTSVHYEVPEGTYRILAYDIEQNGLLNVPSAVPAVVSTAFLHGYETFTGRKAVNVEPPEVNVTTNIFDHFLIINCTSYVNVTNIQGCLVIFSSRLSPEQLHVQIQLRDSLFPLVYSVKPGTRYTITAFAIKDSGILNSTINSMEVYVGLNQSEVTTRYRVDSNAYKIALGVLTSTFIITIIILLIILITKFCATKRKPADQNKPSTIEMHKCEAYEVLPIRRR